MEESDDVSRRLATFRTARGLTLAAVATRAGVTKQFLSLVETGASDINTRTLARVCAAMGISLAKFFGPLPRGVR